MKHGELLEDVIKTTAYLFAGPVAYFLTTLNLNGLSLALYVFIMFLDFITGVLKAERLNSKYPAEYPKVTSYGARRGFISKLVMLLLPLSVGAISTLLNVTGEIGAVTTNTLIVALSLAELFSIFGNIEVIRTGNPIEERDAVSYVIKQVRQKILKTIDRIIGK